MTFTRSSRPPHEKLGIDDDTRVVVLGVPPAGAADWLRRRGEFHTVNH